MGVLLKQVTAALEVARTWKQYDAAKRLAEKLSRPEQFQAVDLLIAAHGRIKAAA
jgi:hypothetical protein